VQYITNCWYRISVHWHSVFCGYEKYMVRFNKLYKYIRNIKYSVLTHLSQCHLWFKFPHFWLKLFNFAIRYAQNPLDTFPRNFPQGSCQLVGGKSKWNLRNDTTQQTRRTFARANLLQTCYGATDVMDFGYYQIFLRTVYYKILNTS